MNRAPPKSNPGPEPISDTEAIRRARDLGIDVELLYSMLRLTPEERLRRLDGNVAFFRSARKVRHHFDPETL
ncbi:hypothetical protein BH23GEM4_BH23GEM4_12850 [soil metagenome]